MIELEIKKIRIWYHSHIVTTTNSYGVLFDTTNLKNTCLHMQIILNNKQKLQW